MCSFIKTSDEWFSLRGRELKLHVKSQIEYYKSVQGCPAKEDVCKLSGGNVPSNDKFSAQFISIYHENDNDIKNNLVTPLLRALVTKMSGQKNARYDDKVRNFFIALAASGNKHAYEFVSGNLGQCMTIHRAKRCIGQCRSTPVIAIEDAEVKPSLELIFKIFAIHFCLTTNELHCLWELMQQLL